MTSTWTSRWSSYPMRNQPVALAFTGIESLDLKVFGGFALILLGLMLVLVGRRNRRGNNVRSH